MSRSFRLACVATLFVTSGCLGSGTSACDDLRALNAAVRGEGLAADAVTCLEGRAANVADSDRAQASTLLLWNSRREGSDPAAWVARAKAHVRAFPGDLDVWVQLANHEQRSGPDAAEQSLAYAREGLAWIQRHPATTPAERRAYHDLLKARAVAAEMMAPPEAPLERRQRTARYARDWWLAARSLDLPAERAMAMCINAGQEPAFCRGEAAQP